MIQWKQSSNTVMGVNACSPVLGFQALLQLLLTKHSVFSPQSLLKAWLGLQSLLITQHRVVVFPKHLVRQLQKCRQNGAWT